MKTLLIAINSKYIHPAMGIYQIIANSNSNVMFDEFTIKDDIETIINYLNTQDVDLIGVSVYIWNIEYIKKILNLLDKRIPILLGGPEASYRAEELLKYKNVHYIIKNEGEVAFNELIEFLSGSRHINEVSNLYYKINGKIYYTFDSLPHINKIKHDYQLINDFKNRIVYLESSRGCPFKCSYCLASLEKKVRVFDIEQVKNDILLVLAQGARTVKFLDRSFNINPEYMIELLSFIKAHDNYHTTYQFEVVGDLLDPKTISYIKTLRKGLIRFEIGIQSTNDLVTNAVKRVQNFEKLQANISEIKDHIIIHADLIAGLPYEDKNSFINTFNQSFLLECEEIQLGFLKELQGTYISKTKDEHGYIFDQKSPYEIIQNKYLTKEELDEIRLVEMALNKYYNSSFFPRTMNYLFKELKLDPYSSFLKIGQYLINHHNQNQLADYASYLFEALKDVTNEKLLFIIKQDYLLKNNIKPKIFWKNEISKEERRKVFDAFIKNYPTLNDEILYRYSQLEKFKQEYFLVTYKPMGFYFLKQL